jgi:transposase
MPGTAAKVRVSEKQLAVLEELSRSRTAAKGIVQRALILVLGFQGLLNEQIAEEVGLNRQQVGVWRKRWRDAWESLCVWECTEPRRLHEAILKVLSDAPRPGCPGKITAEQVAQILAVACESPKLSGRPITCWTHRELRDEVVRRGIVESISVAQVGRYLKQSALQPHRSKMWLNTTEKDPDKFEREAAAVCQTYLEAPCKAAVDGTHTVSVDEATSLQALERNAPDKHPQPGSVTKQEFEYTRHGTTTLTAGLDVVTGQIVSPTLEATRTEPQFVEHIARTVNIEPTGEWIFVVDNLNTHASESLVKWVAEQCGLDDSLGKKTFAASSNR